MVALSSAEVDLLQGARTAGAQMPEGCASAVAEYHSLVDSALDRIDELIAQSGSERSYVPNAQGFNIVNHWEGVSQGDEYAGGAVKGYGAEVHHGRCPILWVSSAASVL